MRSTAQNPVREKALPQRNRKLLGISSGSKTTVWIAEGAVGDTLETPRATVLLHEDEIRSVEGRG